MAFLTDLQNPQGTAYFSGGRHEDDGLRRPHGEYRYLLAGRRKLDEEVTPGLLSRMWSAVFSRGVPSEGETEIFCLKNADGFLPEDMPRGADFAYEEHDVKSSYDSIPVEDNPNPNSRNRM